MRASPFSKPLLTKRLLAALLPLGLAFTASSAFATLQGTDFEGSDGNMAVDSGRDWASFSGFRDDKVQDTPSGQTDNALTGGSKDDLPSMSVTGGGIPNNKDDLDRFYVQSEQIGNNSFVYMAWTRNNTLGTANMSIELNQLVQDAPPAFGGTWALRRTKDDILVLFDFAKGANKPTLSYSRWITTGTPKKDCQANATIPCWGKVKPLLTDASGKVIAEAAINELFSFSDPHNGNKEMAPLTFGEMAINLSGAGLLTTSCQGFGSATLRSRSSASFDSELKDFIAPQMVSIARSADPTGAKASGSGLGGSLVAVTVPLKKGEAPKPVLNLSLPQPPGTNPSVSSSASGVAGQIVKDSRNASQAEFKWPQNDGKIGNVSYKAGGLVTIGLLRNVTTSTVSVDGAMNETSSELVGLSVLGGFITADAVTAKVHTLSTDRSASLSTNGSGLVNLKIGGVAISGTNPNARISLPADKYGEGSYVAVYEVGPATQSGTTSQPALKAFGPYKADVTVTMIRVHVTDDNGPANPLLGALAPGYGGNSLDFVLSSATAHSEFYGIACTAQEVGASATVLNATVDPLASVVLNRVAIPRSGGEQLASLETFKLGGTGLVPTILELGVLQSRATGIVRPFDSSDASSEAGVASVCILPVLGAGCTIDLKVLTSMAQARATASGANASSAGTHVVASIKGAPPIAVPPNTTIPLPGLGFVTLNEQTCDGGGVPNSSGYCVGTTKAGITVTGVRVFLTVPVPGLNIGADIVVTQAHADASYPQQ